VPAGLNVFDLPSLSRQVKMKITSAHFASRASASERVVNNSLITNADVLHILIFTQCLNMNGFICENYFRAC